MELGIRQCGCCGPSHNAPAPPVLAAPGRHARVRCPHRTAPGRCRAAAPSVTAVVAPAPALAADALQKDPRKGIQRDATQLVGATPMVRRASSAPPDYRRGWWWVCVSLESGRKH